jgi:MOSC domain-containing protein YiiM
VDDPVELIGTVIRLQVQTAPLKPRPPGSGRYDPAPLREVRSLSIGPDGCVGDEDVLDVHHAGHAQSRTVRGVNGISVLPAAHYVEMRQRYGDHLAAGAAGENVLLDTGDRPLTAQNLLGELLLETSDGTVRLTDVMAAPPCLEFSRFCVRRDPGDDGDEVRAALDHLDRGTRGFYFRVAGTGTISFGARLLRP